MSSVRQTLGRTIRLTDGSSDRGWDLKSGREGWGQGRPLAGLDEPGVRVRVGPDMRVTVTRGRQIQTLSPPAVPPFNVYGSGYPAGWTVERSGPVLTVTAKASVRIGVMDMADIENVFRWNLTTGRLERCDTVSTTALAGQDRACPGASR
ncbi:hypothetical protein [Deinococcus aquiradiocola]|uniref:Uncharacterized protein n=1 Tax=Deinococcus aquiradiocola TaxID=393059 RepID=A0A917URF4_9DEIO|nr:hypothetical protein [Deinococcus aquiradiocola]GGJ79086.1 hypothetical protein GCM10008939_23680 [Deinococcus aquiradiocola]